MPRSYNHTPKSKPNGVQRSNGEAFETASDSLTIDEQKLLSAYRDFNDEGKEKMQAYVNDLESTGKYKKNLMRFEWCKKKMHNS